jgi:DNA-binding MarR family transcriptional regulator
VTTGPAPDEVDRIVAAWQRERPDLDVAPLQVLSRVTRLARHPRPGPRGGLRRARLERWSSDVLAALRRAGAPYELSPGQLTSETLVSQRHHDQPDRRLERRLLVRRRPDPDDGRGVLVPLQPAGREVVDTALADLLERERTCCRPRRGGRRRARRRPRRLVAPFDAPS